MVQVKPGAYDAGCMCQCGRAAMGWWWWCCCCTGHRMAVHLARCHKQGQMAPFAGVMQR